jgi:hypothetical protein
MFPSPSLSRAITSLTGIPNLPSSVSTSSPSSSLFKNILLFEVSIPFSIRY